MSKLELTEEMVALPVTDMQHVIKEINTDRKVQAAIRSFYKRKSSYQQEYMKRK